MPPHGTQRALGPPAVWVAFAAQGRWKNWVMVLQLLLCALLVFACLRLARTEPNVVVVDETGAGRYVERGVAGSALLAFLETERSRASELTIVSFAERFVRLTAGLSSATVEESWPEALSMMVAPLAQKMSAEAEAEAQSMVETYRRAQLRAALVIDEVHLLQRVGEKAHVRLLASRQRQRLLTGEAVGAPEQLLVNLILVEVPRSRSRVDGLAVLEWASAPAPDSAGASNPPSSDGAPRADSQPRPSPTLPTSVQVREPHTQPEVTP